MEKSYEKMEKYFYILTGMMIFLLVFAFLRNMWMNPGKVDFRPDIVQVTDTGWVMEKNGERKEVTLPVEIPADEKEEVTFIRQCRSEELKKGMLVISNERQHLVVELDGQEVFRLEKPGETLPTSIYEYCLIPVEEQVDGCELKITFSHCRGGVAKFTEVYLCCPSEAFALLLSHDTLQIIILIICVTMTLSVGVVLVCLALRGQRKHVFSSLFFLLLCVSFWTGANMWSSPLLPVSNQMLSWLIYSSLMVLPIPVGLFAYYSTENYKSRLLLLVVMGEIFLTMVQQILYLTHRVPLYDMVKWVHGMLLLIAVSSLVVQIKNYRMRPSIHGKLLIIIFLLPILLVLVSVPLFWALDYAMYSSVLLIGMLVFLFLLLIDAVFLLVSRQIDSKKAETELEMLHNLSYKDGLTSLGNRRAFDEYLEQVEKMPLQNALLVFMDLNGLKTMNDTFGHVAGDELLLTAGVCIREAFGQEGQCFRLGGDEFAAVLVNPDKGEAAYNELLDAALARANQERKVPVSLARGFDWLIDSEGIRKSLSLWRSNADREMYADKMRTRMLLTREDASLVESFHIDEMSGILNTEGFRQNAVRLLCQYTDKDYSLWYYDLKKFKFVNDFFGYEMGDKLIRYLGNLLLESIHKGELCGHITGDCFVSLLQITEKEAIEEHFNYIVSNLNQYLEVLKISYRLEIGVGIYLLKPEDMRSPDINQMMDWANVAQRSIKNLHGSQYALFGEEMWQRQWRDQYINQTLEEEMKNGNISVWFQPQYDFATGKMVGAEVLCRWMHTSLGWLFPSEFISSLERTGQISKLDAYVREEVCRLMRRWRSSSDMEEMSVSVNISRNSVMESNYIEALDELLDRYQLPHSALRLEITESAYVDRPELLVEAVNLLHEHGYFVEMDDFGSGFSSLNMLKDVNVDLLKLDIKFLQGGTHRSRGAQIIHGVVQMARELNIAVLTEGVEDKEQALFLSSIGCPLMQGYYFSKAVPVHEFEQLLRKEKEKRMSESFVTSDALWVTCPDAHISGEVYEVICAEYQLNSLGLIVNCDENFTRITGYTWEEVCDKHLSQNDLIPEEDRAAYWSTLRSKWNLEPKLCLKHRVIRKDGQKLLLHCFGEQVLDKYTGETRTAIHLQCDATELPSGEETSS